MADSKNHPVAETPQVLEAPPDTALDRLRLTETQWRYRLVTTIAPRLSAARAESLYDLSERADDILDELTTIDFTTIDDCDLRPARIFVGLTFIGFGSLMILFLLMYFGVEKPVLGRNSWHAYIWFVGLGVAGMFMLAREAMRPQDLPMDGDDE